MGMYIEVPEAKNKAKQITDLYGAVILGHDNPSWELVAPGEALSCVVENAHFDAAAYCYSKDEMEAFLPTRSDQRPRTWLQLDKTKVEELVR